MISNDLRKFKCHSYPNPFYAGTSNYVGCGGAQGSDGGALVRVWPQSGAVGAVKFANITDGTANVFAVGERDQRCGAGCWAGAKSHGDNVFCMAYCRGKPNDSLLTIGTDPSGCDCFNHNCHWGFSSQHPDGVNVLMCDGSVHFLSDLIATKTGSYTQSNGTQCTNWNPVNTKTQNVTAVVPPGAYQFLADRDDGNPLPSSAF